MSNFEIATGGGTAAGVGAAAAGFLSFAKYFHHISKSKEMSSVISHVEHLQHFSGCVVSFGKKFNLFLG